MTISVDPSANEPPDRQAFQDTDTSSCRLCKTPLNRRKDSQGEFCCQGCARVFDVLEGLSEADAAVYRDAAKRLGIIPGAESPRAASESVTLPKDDHAIRTTRVLVCGMTCPSCSWIVEQILRAQRGVIKADVSFSTGSVLLQIDYRLTSLGRLDDFLKPLGYGLGEASGDERVHVGRRVTFEFLASAVITMNLMSLSALRYFGSLNVLRDSPRWLGYVELGLTIPVMVLAYLPALRRAVLALRRRTLTMNFLISLSVGTVFFLSLGSLVSGGHEIYFETCAGLLTILLLSRMVEARLRDAAIADISSLMHLPVLRVCRLDTTGRESYVEIPNISLNDVVLFHPGETVPFDGQSESGEVHISEAVLTGEPRPLRKRCGDRIVAGSSVVANELRLRVTRLFGETQLKRILDDVRQALRSYECRLRSGDRLAQWFTPCVVGVAALAWLGRMLWFGLDFALQPEGWFPSVTVMVVACPCAFSLAGISVIAAAVGALLRRGIVVKEPSQLEDLHTIKHLVFDKTGTLTHADMEVETIAWQSDARPDLLRLALAVETGSKHPVAQSICAFIARTMDCNVPALESIIEEVQGMGRRTKATGHVFAVGARDLFSEPFVPLGASDRHTLVWFGFDGRAEGCFLLADRIRAEAALAVRRLKGLGYGLELFSGDRQEVCQWVGNSVGIVATTGGISLEEKCHRIKQYRNGGRAVLYVGDGTNDALAMAEATASVALGKSTDEALFASGFVFTDAKLSALPCLLSTGQKVSRVIRENYAWALVFNLIFIPIAIAGELSPLLAMILMLASSIAVLTNSLRLRKSLPD